MQVKQFDGVFQWVYSTNMKQYNNRIFEYFLMIQEHFFLPFFLPNLAKYRCWVFGLYMHHIYMIYTLPAYHFIRVVTQRKNCNFFFDKKTPYFVLTVIFKNSCLFFVGKIGERKYHCFRWIIIAIFSISKDEKAPHTTTTTDGSTRRCCCGEMALFLP